MESNMRTPYIDFEVDPENSSLEALSPKARPRVGDSAHPPSRTVLTPHSSASADPGEGDTNERTADLKQCEHRIEHFQNAQLEAARAIRRITKERLYRERDFDTVAAYAKAHHDISKQRWYQLVAYATVYEALSQQKDAITDSLADDNPTAEESTAVDFALPSVEAHTRPLQPYKDDPELLATLWCEILSRHGSNLTRAKIDAVVRQATAPHENNPDGSDQDTQDHKGDRNSSGRNTPITNEAGDKEDDGEADDDDDSFKTIRARYAPHLDDSIPKGVAESIVSIAAVQADSDTPTVEDVKAAREQFESFGQQETDFVPVESVEVLPDSASDPEEQSAATTPVDPSAVMSPGSDDAHSDLDTESGNEASGDTASDDTASGGLTNETLTDLLMAVPLDLMTPAMAAVAVPIGVPQAQREVGVPLSFFAGRDQTAEAFAQEIVEHYLTSDVVSGLNATNEHVDWAAHTINPVTGCLHTCEYCYARSMGEKRYKQGFYPTFFPRRLASIRHASGPTGHEHVREKNVFVGSMSDIFGKWIPDWMIQMVLDAIEYTSDLNFLFLTKFPQKMSSFEFPDNSWVGTTVDRQSEVDRAEKHLAQVEASVKWLSCEPMLEPLEFDDLSVFDTVVIGAQKAYAGTCEEIQPEFGWIADLCAAAREAGCTIYLKENLVLELPKELPTTA